MAKDPNQSRVAISSSDQLQEKLQQLKDFYEKGQSPVHSKPAGKEVFNPPYPKKHLSRKNQNEEGVKDKKNTFQVTPPLQQEVTPQQEAKQKRFLQMKSALDWLIQTYPACFSWREPKPLKRRIEKDIFTNLPAELPFSRLSIREAVAYYTRSMKYKQALIDNSHRYNLQGEQVEAILPEHQQLAQNQLTELMARQEARARTRKNRPFKKEPPQNKPR